MLKYIQVTDEQYNGLESGVQEKIQEYTLNRFEVPDSLKNEHGYITEKDYARLVSYAYTSQVPALLELHRNCTIVEL